MGDGEELSFDERLSAAKLTFDTSLAAEEYDPEGIEGAYLGLEDVLTDAPEAGAALTSLIEFNHEMADRAARAGDTDNEARHDERALNYQTALNIVQSGQEDKEPQAAKTNVTQLETAAAKGPQASKSKRGSRKPKAT